MVKNKPFNFPRHCFIKHLIKYIWVLWLKIKEPSQLALIQTKQSIGAHRLLRFDRWTLRLNLRHFNTLCAKLQVCEKNYVSCTEIKYLHNH